MTLLERLIKAGWTFKEPYEFMEVYERGIEQLLYLKEKDEVRLVYGIGTNPYRPKGLEIESLCN